MAKNDFTAEQLAPCAGANGADANALPDRELVVSIYPQAYQFYDIEGTRRQLEDEGLIAKDLVWPERDFEIRWERDGVRYELQRKRPADLKGPRKLWIEGDWWQLRGVPAKKEACNEIEIRLQRKRLAKMVYDDSPEGRFWASEEFRKHCEAQRDKGFLSFMCAVLPPPNKRKVAKRGQAS